MQKMLSALTNIFYTFNDGAQSYRIWITPRAVPEKRPEKYKECTHTVEEGFI